MPRFSRVYLEITNICNRACSFCHRTKRAPKRMSKDEFLHISTDLRPLTDYLYFHVMGEPLTHPQLCDFIKVACEMGYKCAITTNGTLLQARREELLSSGVYKINISLHSFEERRREEHERYVDAVLDFADEASERGILTVLRLWNLGFDEGKNDRVLEKITTRFGENLVLGARGARIRHKLHIEYGERFEWPDAKAHLYGDEVFCYGMKDHIGILSDGTVIPCCLDSDGEIGLGNAFSTPISEIIDSPRALAIREGFKCRRAVEELCKRCGYARRFDK